MGRYVRWVIRGLAAQPDVRLTLLVRDPGNAPAYREISAEADVAPLSAARGRAAFEAIWYPWNGIRFAAHAPAIVTINDDFAFRYPARGAVARWREQRPIRRATERAQQILTISAWARDSLIERFALDPARICVIPLGPDPLFVPGDARSPYAEPFVLAVGSREARKNIGFLIDVFERAFPARAVRLVIVGPLDAALRARVESARLLVTELLDVDDLRLRDLYRSCAVVAVPSLAEGFGLVAVEAQACGAPVIAANTSALPEAVGEAGILLALDDTHGWTAALRELVSNTALNAYYRSQSVRRWPGGSADRTIDGVRAALERAIDDLG